MKQYNLKIIFQFYKNNSVSWLDYLNSNGEIDPEDTFREVNVLNFYLSPIKKIWKSYPHHLSSLNLKKERCISFIN